MEVTEKQEVLQQVINEARLNEAFKKELVANPVKAIEKLTGCTLELPEGKTLIIRDQTDENTVFINIPANAQFDAELKEEELEKVAGGCQIGDSGIGIGRPGRPYDYIRPMY